MTVNTTDITSGPYTGTGGTSQFSYDFKVETKLELTVFETDDADNQVTLTVDVDYTVNNVGTEGGGTIDRIAGNLPTDYEWYIRSNYTATQDTDFSSQGNFFPNVHEIAFDKLTFLFQQATDRVNRAFRILDSDSGTGDLTIPTTALRANKLLSFDAAGNALATQTIGTWRSSWVTATAYGVRDTFKDGNPGNVYITLLAHTSTNVTADLAANKIEIILDATASTNLPSIGGGDVGKILEVNVAENGYDLVAKFDHSTLGLPTISGGDVGKRLEVNVAEDGYDLTAVPSRSDHNKVISYMTRSGNNSMFLLVDGKLYSTSGSSASLPNNTTGRGLDNQVASYGCDNFKEVPIPSTSPIVKVGGGYGMVGWALLTNNELYTWGLNTNGQCGLGHLNAVAIPELAQTDVTDVYDNPTNGEVARTNSRLFIKKTDGFIYGTGYNINGALGVGDILNKSSFTKLTALGLNVIGFWNMGATYGCAVAQKSDHTIWIAGEGSNGSLGNGSTTAANSSFVDLTTAWGGAAGYVLEKVIGGMGITCSMGMLLDNATTTVFRTCGYNTDGQLGDGTFTQATTPVTPSVGAGRIADISGIGDLLCVKVLKEDNDLYSFGYNVSGQVGDGTIVDRNTPIVVQTDVTDLFNDGMVADATGAEVQSFIKKTDNQLYACGVNDDGQCGHGTITANIENYTRVALPFDANIIDMGNFTTLGDGRINIAKATNNKLYAWGNNLHNGVTSASLIDGTVPMSLSITDDNI